MSLTFTILGCSSSTGVPRVALGWGAADPANPKNRRRRCSLLVERHDPAGKHTAVLVDTSPDLREQLLDAEVDWLDAVLFTHEHADHTHGIDDLRAFTVRRDGPLPMYGSAQTLESLRRKFTYIFDDSRPMAGTSKPEGRAHVVEANKPFLVGDVEVLPVPIPHGSITVFGYRIGGLAYVTDAKSVPPEALEQLRGAEVLVINALFRTEHPTHLSIPESLKVAEQIGAERTYLIHLTHDNFHADLEAELPRGIAPAFDGLTIRVP